MKWFRSLTLAILWTMALGLSSCGNEPQPAPLKPGGLQVGDSAADFSLMDASGHIRKLSDVQKDWYLVLVFYRGHWCGACQNQLLNLKDDFAKFAPLHATLAAVSVDSVEESADFNHNWNLPFPLLSDSHLSLIDSYGIRHPKGHEEKDISRPCVVIIDPQKTIRYKFVGVLPTDRPSDNEILFTLQKLEQETPQKP